jgi:Na+/H+ antiporter NhaC
MRRAERRVREGGQVLRPGAVPLIGGQETGDSTGQQSQSDDSAGSGKSASIGFELLLPVGLVIGIGAGTLVIGGSVKIVEAFMAGVAVLLAVLAVRGRLGGMSGLADAVMTGAQNVMPALMIVALAYALNAVAAQLGVGEALVRWFDGTLAPHWLVTLTFLITAAIAFATGTSCGGLRVDDAGGIAGGAGRRGRGHDPGGVPDRRGHRRRRRLR